jgi:hypothetical protein
MANSLPQGMNPDAARVNLAAFVRVIYGSSLGWLE